MSGKKTPKKPKSRNSDTFSDDASRLHRGSPNRPADELPDFISRFQVSPSVQRSPGGQLTGLPRKVKDSCAEWHNYILEWNNNKIKGKKYASEIANEKLSASEELQDDESPPDLSHVMPPGLEDICKKLKAVYVALEAIVRKFEVLTSNLQGVARLRDNQRSSETDEFEEPLFQSWPAHLFYETSEVLLNMYRKELSVKKSVVENIAHSKDRDTLMLYIAVWQHEPCIHHTATQQLEGMLLETGLR